MNPMAPYFWLAKVAAVALGVIGLAYGIHAWNDTQQQIGYDRAVNKYQVEKAAADLQALAKERQLRKDRDDAEQQAAEREAKLRADYAAAHAAARGLRDTVTDLRGRLAATTLETCRTTADAALAVFGECTDRYRAVAEAADGHRSDVETLSDAWPVLKLSGEMP